MFRIFIIFLFFIFLNLTSTLGLHLDVNLHSSLNMNLNASELKFGIEKTGKSIDDSQNIMKIHQDLKSSYVKAIMEKDKESQIAALKYLIKTSKMLNENFSHYSDELLFLEKDLSKNGENSENDKSVENGKNGKNSENISTKDGVFAAASNANIDTSGGDIVQKRQALESLQTSKNNGESNFDKSGKPPKITNVMFEKSEIILKFDREISQKNIKFFKIKNNNIYKNVFDLEAIFVKSFYSQPLSVIKNIKIAQNPNNITRVVLEDNEPIDSTLSVENDTIKIKIATRSSAKIVNEDPSENVSSKIQPQSQNTQQNVQSTPNIQPSTQPNLQNVQSDLQQQKHSKIIVIDPGHGGKDPGAIGYNRYREKIIVLDISKKLAAELRKKGHQVFLTRNNDEYIELRARTGLANTKNADLFLSIHCNAAPNEKSYLSMKGVETFFLSNERGERSKSVAALENKGTMDDMNYFSQQAFLNFLNREKILASNKLAIDIQRGMLSMTTKKYDVVDGGVREGPFWVLVGAQMPAALVEIGYITNPQEAKNLVNPIYQNSLALGIAVGIDNYLSKN